MTPILATFVDGGRILETRSHTDPRLPNGRRMFRRTQGFADVNKNLPAPLNTQPHNAIDVGNFECGDLVYAPIAGQARTFTDAYGSRNVLIRSGEWSVLIGHLQEWLIPQGTSTVTRRQPIACVGKTGLGAVCHCHLALYEHPVGGGKAIARDPWPQLEQFHPEENMATDFSEATFQLPKIVTVEAGAVILLGAFGDERMGTADTRFEAYYSGITVNSRHLCYRLDVQEDGAWWVQQEGLVPESEIPFRRYSLNAVTSEAVAHELRELRLRLAAVRAALA